MALFWIAFGLVLLAGGQDEGGEGTAGQVHFYGSLTVESLPPYGHPGTPLSAIRIMNEDDALATVGRFSLRPLSDARAGFGPCITLQGRFVDGEPDRDMAHLCAVMNSDGGVRIELWARNADTSYRLAQVWDEPSPQMFRKEELR